MTHAEAEKKLIEDPEFKGCGEYRCFDKSPCNDCVQDEILIAKMKDK